MYNSILICKNLKESKNNIEMNLFCHIAGPFMVVVTGQPSTDLTQVVNLNTNGNDCSALAPYKFFMRGGAGGLLNHQHIICGGYSSGVRKDDCYKYNTISQDWSKFANLQTARYAHAATTMSDGSLWFTGKTISIYELYAFS